MQVEDKSFVEIDELDNQYGVYWAPEWNVTGLWYFVEEHGLLVELCLSYILSFFEGINFVNTIIYIGKVVPMVICMFQLIKNIYIPSRQRIKQKQIELDDLQHQVELLDNKLKVQDLELEEEAEELRRATERLLQARARARDVIASDELLRHAVCGDRDHSEDSNGSRPDDADFMIDLLKELKHGTSDVPNRMDCGEPQNESADNSIYSSLSEEGHQGCRVKIVKVTNVYKVAYLKNYMQHRRMKRKSREAELNKNVDNITKLLREWQETLSTVSRHSLAGAGAGGAGCAGGTGDRRERHSLRSSSSDTDLNSEMDRIADWDYRAYSDETEPTNPEGPVYQQGRYELAVLPEETNSQLQLAETKSDSQSLVQFST